MAAYTRSESIGIQEGWGDQVSSLFAGGNYAVNGSNHQELGHSAFVAPHRVIANVSYRLQEGRHLATTFGIFYEGYNQLYVGNNSYTRMSYVIGTQSGQYTNPVTGEGGSLNLIYIPTDSQLSNMVFTSEDNKAEYKSFLESDKYLSAHRGEYSTRGGVVAPWLHRFNFKIAQDFIVNIAGRPTTLQIGADVLNVGNLINPNWGLAKQYSSENILKISNGTYSFTAPKVNTYKSIANTWQALLSARIFF